jgi:hypothetical protein
MNIWTSPYTHIPYFYTGYHSIDALAKGYGVTYLGWSEDLSGVRIVEYVTPPAPAHPYTVQTITSKEVAAPNGATKWDLNDTTWAQFNDNSEGKLAPNTPITVVAIAHHNLGGQYYMEDANAPSGYNVIDVEDYTPPAPPPEPTPAPSPAPTTPASPNEPTPQPTPSTPDTPATQVTPDAPAAPVSPAPIETRPETPKVSLLERLLTWLLNKLRKA